MMRARGKGRWAKTCLSGRRARGVRPVQDRPPRPKGGGPEESLSATRTLKYELTENALGCGTGFNYEKKKKKVYGPNEEIPFRL